MMFLCLLFLCLASLRHIVSKGILPNFDASDHDGSSDSETGIYIHNMPKGRFRGGISAASKYTSTAKSKNDIVLTKRAL